MSDTHEELPTTAQGDQAVEAAEQLCRALDQIGDALGGLDAKALLASEEALGRAIAALAATRVVVDRRSVLDLVRRARMALLRCRRLGASYSGVARALANVGVVTDGYDCAGGYAGRVDVPPSVRIRV